MGVAPECGVEVQREREACAVLVEHMTMGEILLAAGEMTAGERRTVKALQKWLAHKIRTRNDQQPRIRSGRVEVQATRMPRNTAGRRQRNSAARKG